MASLRILEFSPESDLVARVSWNINEGNTPRADAPGAMVVTLKHGTETSEYTHINVPLSDAILFQQAESAGSYYNQHIKGKYSIYVDPQASELGARALTLLDDMMRENAALLAENGRLGKDFLHLDRFEDKGKEITRRIQGILQEFHKLQRGSRR